MEPIESDVCHPFVILSHREYTYKKSKVERDILKSQYMLCSKLTEEEIDYFCVKASQGTLTIDSNGRLRGFSFVTINRTTHLYSIHNLCGDIDSIDMALKYYTIVRQREYKKVNGVMEIFLDSDPEKIEVCKKYDFLLDESFQSSGPMREIRMYKKC